MTVVLSLTHPVEISNHRLLQKKSFIQKIFDDTKSLYFAKEYFATILQVLIIRITQKGFVYQQIFAAFTTLTFKKGILHIKSLYFFVAYIYFVLYQS